MPEPSVDFTHGPLRVAENRRFLVHEDGTPFFYLGDTAWELFHRLSREEADRYLTDRAAKGFTVIQAVVLAELDGLHAPNAYGKTPLEDDDPTRPNEAYFSHVDRIVQRAEELGMFVGMLPTWGDKWKKDWGVGPVVFTPENAEAYGELLGARYAEAPVIWILGGDRNPETDEHIAIIRAMARGLARGDGGRHLMTFHPQGGASSSRWFHGEEWLDFNMIQSGHSEKHLPNYRMVAADYARDPIKPTLDGEPRYEDHPVDWKPDEKGWFDDYDVRQAAYWALFAGALGHTYGCHDIWQFHAPGRKPISFARTPWQEALDLPGAAQMGHARRLIESRPFLSRIPDQALLACEEGIGDAHLRATRCAEGRYAMVYVPAADQTVAVHLDPLAGEAANAWWFDPRTGEATPIEQELPARGTREFVSPEQGPDWVLVLDAAERDFPPPGHRES